MLKPSNQQLGQRWVVGQRGSFSLSSTRHGSQIPWRQSRWMLQASNHLTCLLSCVAYGVFKKPKGELAGMLGLTPCSLPSPNSSPREHTFQVSGGRRGWLIKPQETLVRIVHPLQVLFCLDTGCFLAPRLVDVLILQLLLQAEACGRVLCFYLLPLLPSPHGWQSLVHTTVLEQ